MVAARDTAPTIWAMRVRLIALFGLAMILSGCGSISHQTRDIPTGEDRVWRSEIHELPHRPPALGDTHYPRSHVGEYHPGQPAHQAHYDTDHYTPSR